MGCQGVRPKAQHVEDGRNPPASSGSVPCPMVADQWAVSQKEDDSPVFGMEESKRSCRICSMT